MDCGAPHAAAMEVPFQPLVVWTTDGWLDLRENPVLWSDDENSESSDGAEDAEGAEGGGYDTVSVGKLRHDAEQLAHLLSLSGRGRRKEEERSRAWRLLLGALQVVLQLLERQLAGESAAAAGVLATGCGGGGDDSGSGSNSSSSSSEHTLLSFERLQQRRWLDKLPPAQLALVAAAYNRALYVRSENGWDADGAPATGEAGSPRATALNPQLDVAALGAEWQRQGEWGAGGASRTLRLLVVDELLTSSALAELRAFCLESTVWYAVRAGYLEASVQEGFATPLLPRLAEELRAALPVVFGTHQLTQLRARKYAQLAPVPPPAPSARGPTLHANQAAVAVTLWVTPDSANLAPADAERNGGMSVYDVPSSPQWELTDCNSMEPGLQALARDYLRKCGARRHQIPHRANRAVIFDGALFHETSEHQFESGYTNRRIVITLLFGESEFINSGSG